MVRAIEILAEREGETPEFVYAEMQNAIDLAWADPANRDAIIRLTGEETVPTPEALIAAITAAVTP